MKNFKFLSFMLVIGVNLSTPLSAQQNQVSHNSFLENLAGTTRRITSDEILKSSIDFRHEGGTNRSDFRDSTVNDVAERENLSNMEKLEFLKYLLDTGFAPLPPYINISNYFTQNDLSSEDFPTVEDIHRLQEVCRMRDWPCDDSPLSFMRLALFSTPFLRESGQTLISYTDLEELFAEFGYTSDDFTAHNLMVLEQFLKDLHYAPGWTVQPNPEYHIKDVTDDNFQTEVIDASREKPVIVYFYASWCFPCYTMTPIMDELAREFEGAFTLAKIYVNGNPNSQGTLSIETIPTLIFYRNGEIISKRYGGLPRVDASDINTYISSLFSSGNDIDLNVVGEVRKIKMRNEVRDRLGLEEESDTERQNENLF